MIASSGRRPSWSHATPTSAFRLRVTLGNRRAQAADMVIPPGDAEGDPSNRHRGADQWLFVVAGRGVATVNGRRHALRAGTLVVIERGNRHEVRNTGCAPLRTLNFYVPPAYRRDGEPLPRASGRVNRCE